MGKKNKLRNKVQVVICHKALTNKFFLLMQMCEERNGYWQNVTGSVDKNEEFEIAAFRELLEETGFDRSMVKKLTDLEMDFNFEARNKSFHEKVYLAELNEKINPKLSNEHQDYKWISQEEINPSIVNFESNFNALLKASELAC